MFAMHFRGGGGSGESSALHCSVQWYFYRLQCISGEFGVVVGTVRCFVVLFREGGRWHG